MNKQEYRCYLFKRVDGKTVSHIFTGEDQVEEALKDGWHTTFADFVNESQIAKEKVEVAKEVCSMIVGDMNVAANYKDIEDMQKLKDVYYRLTGNHMDKKIKTLKGARKAISLIVDSK